MSVTAANNAAFRTAHSASGGQSIRAPKIAAPIASVHPQHIFIATINPAVGDTGVQTHTRTLRDGLTAAEVACDVVTPFARSAQWLPVFAVRRVLAPFNPSAATRWYRHWHAAALRQSLQARIRRELATHSRPDITILAQCPVSAQAALDVRESLDVDFPVAMVCHFNFSEAREYRDKGELPDEQTYRAMLDFEHRVLSAVDHVIYVSAWARQVVENERGIQVRGASVIWNGIGASGANAVSRAELGLNNDDLVLINVGTLESRKNQINLIDLFAAIAKQSPRARLVLVGDGPQRADIRRKIEQRGLALKVRMLGMRHDVPALLAAADLYVHYALLENCPVVLLEAARASLPIAAVPGGGVPELLESLGGMSLDANDVARSLESLQPLLADAATRKRAGEIAHAAFDRTFTRDAMIAAYLKALANCGSGEVSS